LDLAVEHADLIAGGEDVSEVEHLLVGEPLGDLVGGGVGEGDPGEFGLDPVNLVAEDPPAATDAKPVPALPAETAAAAGRDARQQHVITLLDRAYAWSGLGTVATAS
jgi:hypothetical protein